MIRYDKPWIRKSGDMWICCKTINWGQVGSSHTGASPLSAYNSYMKSLRPDEKQISSGRNEAVNHRETVKCVKDFIRRGIEEENKRHAHGIVENLISSGVIEDTRMIQKRIKSENSKYLRIWMFIFVVAVFFGILLLPDLNFR